MDSSTEQPQSKIKWHLRPVAVIIAILCVGPLALPVVWLSPAFKKIHKILITITLLIITLWLVKTLMELGTIFLEQMRDLQQILNP